MQSLVLRVLIHLHNNIGFELLLGVLAEEGVSYSGTTQKRPGLRTPWGTCVIKAALGGSKQQTKQIIGGGCGYAQKGCPGSKA